MPTHHNCGQHRRLNNHMPIMYNVNREGDHVYVYVNWGDLCVRDDRVGDLCVRDESGWPVCEH